MPKFSARADTEAIDSKKILRRFLRKTLKPFEDNVPESGFVAEANFQDKPGFYYLMPDERREMLKRPASHTALDGFIVIAR